MPNNSLRGVHEIGSEIGREFALYLWRASTPVPLIASFIHQQRSHVPVGIVDDPTCRVRSPGFFDADHFFGRLRRRRRDEMPSDKLRQNFMVFCDLVDERRAELEEEAAYAASK